MVDREKFITKAHELKGSYVDYGRCMYSFCKDEGILEEAYDYMINQAKDVNDFDKKVYVLMGSPTPDLIIVDEDGTETIIKQKWD
jgi:hypothetical protein